MAMPRLPKTLQSPFGHGSMNPGMASVCRASCASRLYSSVALTCPSTAARTSLAGPAATPAAAAASAGSSPLGRCRIVIRNKHHAAPTAPTPLPTSKTLAGQNQRRHSHLAAAAHPSSPPPPAMANTRPQQPQQQNTQSSLHMSASAFPAASNPASHSYSSSQSPQSSPLFKMNNPASIVPQAAHQPRRRYSPQHFYQNRILDPYVNQAVNPITLRQLVFFGRNMQEDKLLKSANYVRTELPVRLAHRIRDFQNLPFIVGTNPHIELVYDLYWQAFEKLSKIPEIRTLEENDAFCEQVKSLLNDHLVVIPQLALGIMECSKHIPAQQVDQFMNKMLRSRISRRVLAEQHISLTANYNSPNHMMTDRGFIGIIYTHCNPREIVERTALLAAETCRQALGGGGAIRPPKVILDGNLDAEFSYIPDHIEYILYELLKNSMRFVMLNGTRDKRTNELPPIHITVCEGTHDIVFRVSDKGGGIHPEMESHLWSYSQSPARFANFEKISKMAATVQEQFVSPSASVNAGSGYAAADPSSSSSSSHMETAGQGESDGEGIVLPPPPTSNKNPTYPPTESSSSPSSSFSTSTAQAQSLKDQAMHLGIGLPMSKVYAEYWGGDLKVFTMHGYGTDAYAKFCKFGNIYENFDV
ncbi:hypothetical protein BGZ70_003013 [Mortierella alpina]|uniref:Protein-serine/threonine kinase n=1 Tax=Mortierella alpina TaxID=64518 RepID=A0A9P6JAN7_MORAP|nr:hypothetical protein BGZ70_003013 [Mortierella alpina]